MELHQGMSATKDAPLSSFWLQLINDNTVCRPAPGFGVSAKYCFQGPLADRKGCEEHVLIVGAGMAGLTSALLLLEAGHRSGTWEAQGETVG